MKFRNDRQFSIASLLVLTLFTAVLIAIPRLTAGMTLSPVSILWIVTLHQIAVASTIAAIVWILAARRKSMAIFLAGFIVLMWGPNLGATIERSVTGSNTMFISTANAIGIAPYLNTFYSTTYDWLGYDYRTKPM